MKRIIIQTVLGIAALAISINYGDYLKKDIEKVIDMMIKTSKQNVELSDNLKKD